MIQEVGETSMPLAPGAVNGQNKTRIRGPGFRGGASTNSVRILFPATGLLVNIVTRLNRVGKLL